MSTNIQNSAIETLLSLTRIDPNLNIVDPQYTENLNGYLRALQSNIDQILSIPFLQGRQGDSVLIGEFPLFDEEADCVTEVGQELIKALFPRVPESEWYWNSVSGWQDIVDGIPEYAPVHDVHAWENLCPNEDYSMKVQLYYTVDYDTNDKKILSSSRYFVYYDPRLAQISGGLDSNEVFRDTSAAVFRESYEENSETLWHFVNKGILPTIYWSAENGYWCWSINNIDTGIRCEGVKGEDGKDGNARVVKADVNTNATQQFDGMSVGTITYVFDQTEGWVDTGFDTLLEDNMNLFVIISYNGSSSDLDLGFGTAYFNTSDNNWESYVYTATTLRSLSQDLDLKTLLNTINTDTGSLKGLYIKDIQVENNDICHALYCNTQNKLTIAPVNYSDFVNNRITEDGNENILNIKYYKTEFNSNSLGFNSIVNLYNTLDTNSQLKIRSNNLKIERGNSINPYIELNTNHLKLAYDYDRIGACGLELFKDSRLNNLGIQLVGDALILDTASFSQQTQRILFNKEAYTIFSNGLIISAPTMSIGATTMSISAQNIDILNDTNINLIDGSLHIQNYWDISATEDEHWHDFILKGTNNDNNYISYNSNAKYNILDIKTTRQISSAAWRGGFESCVQIFNNTTTIPPDTISIETPTYQPVFGLYINTPTTSNDSAKALYAYGETILDGDVFLNVHNKYNSLESISRKGYTYICIDDTVFKLVKSDTVVSGKYYLLLEQVNVN